MSLAYERLDVYRYATQHLALALRITEGTSRPPGFLTDQYRRAALSIPLNIAEGVGKTGADEQRRFYAIARGSAMECGAILEAATMLGVVDEATLRSGKQVLERIVRILSVLCMPRRLNPETAAGGGGDRRRGRSPSPSPGPGPGPGPRSTNRSVL